ncbi:subtilase-type protease inhibitor [Nocardia terpenica]|uniref:Protease inhibitor protein n=1 Tax=Nocardia terpenica TaxID=455432 RepID=A0A6G9Z035_9NOCA|nr:subtilase-type protease inhibitor [Nocardia terpenica]QIS18858.1 protease inhibitor protein [Nocardia terpenica]
MSLGVRTVSAVAAGMAVAALAAAPAQADPPPGPDLSALILTVTHGNSPVRTAVLMCAPMALGTHPQVTSACDELNAVGGNFDALRGQPMRFCSMLYDPVTLTADGFWHGAPVSWRQSFPNQCMATNHSNYVFTF